MTETTITTAPAPTLLKRLWTGLGKAYGAVYTRLWVWSKTGNTDAARGLAVLLVALAVIAWAVHALWFKPAPEPPAPVPAPVASAGLQAQIDALSQRVADLERIQTDPASTPEPVPYRRSAPSAPRAAPRPQEAPTQAPQKRWGTTDLDREIAAFPSTSMEQAK